MATQDRARGSRVTKEMRRLALVPVFLLGCGGGTRPPSDAKRAPAPAPSPAPSPKPAPAADSAPVSAFHVAITTQEFGAGVGPLETIDLDDKGALTYQIGAEPAHHVTVAADRRARIALLLADPSLPSSASSGPRGEG